MDNFITCLDVIFSNELLSITLLVFLMYATYTDIKYLKISNKVNLMLVITRIIFIFIPVYSLNLSVGNIIASVSAFLAFLTLAMIFMHRMGGDIKFIGAFMLFFNMEYMVVFVAIASVLNMIYSISLKIYLQNKKESLLERQEGCNVKEQALSIFIKLFLVKTPKDSELLTMDNKDFNKYKLPFAPFFLMSYIITYILYLV